MGEIERHPDRRSLQQFGQGALALEESRLVVRHLLTGCQRCRQVTARFLPSAAVGRGRSSSSPAASHLPTASTPSSAVFYDYRPAFCVADGELTRRQIALAQELEEALALRQEIAGRPFAEQWRLVTGDGRFHTWSFCDLLLDDSREWGFQDSGRAKELAELGAGVAACLSVETYGEHRVRDLAGRAWATLANVERIRADFRAAELGLAKAEQLLRSGTGDPVEKAGFLLMMASLRGNQGKHREALSLLDRVLKIARRSGEHHLAGQALISRGIVLGTLGECAEAIRMLAEGLSEIASGSSSDDFSAEPRLRRLLVAARHNLIHYLSETGLYAEALALLAPTRALYATLADRLSEVRLQWVEGRIYLGLGDLERAEGLLREAAGRFVVHELPYEAALVFLDLARIYLRQGRGSEMRRLAAEALPIFRATLVERDILAAFIVFQKAAEMERVTVDLVQEFSTYLQSCRASASSRSVESL